MFNKTYVPGNRKEVSNRDKKGKYVISGNDFRKMISYHDMYNATGSKAEIAENAEHVKSYVGNDIYDIIRKGGISRGYSADTYENIIEHCRRKLGIPEDKISIDRRHAKICIRDLCIGDFSLSIKTHPNFSYEITNCVFQTLLSISVEGQAVFSRHEILLFNNKIYSLQISDDKALINGKQTHKAIIKMGTGNEIGVLWYDGGFVVYFSEKQRINKDEVYENIDLNKRALNILKKEATDREDWLQVAVLKRELIICEGLVKKRDRQYLPIWEWEWGDLLTFWWGKWTSSHGISWIRPLGWIVVLNLLFALLAYSSIHIDGDGLITYIEPLFLCESKYWGYFFSYLNPIFLLSSEYCSCALGCETCEPPWWTHALDFIHRVLYILLVYEMIRAGRRFTR